MLHRIKNVYIIAQDRIDFVSKIVFRINQCIFNPTIKHMNTYQLKHYNNNGMPLLVKSMSITPLETFQN